MAKFVSKKLETFRKMVEVFCGDETRGELGVTYSVMTQDKFDDLTENGNDYDLCKAAIHNIDDIEVEDSQDNITGQDAIDLVLKDTMAVAACAASYMEALKGKNFRAQGSKRRR